MPADVAGVDERLEVVRRAEAAGRREEAGDLIAPRAGERVLHHRQQLDVGVAHLLDVRDQPLGQLAVRQVAVAVVAARAPTIRDAPRRPTSAGRTTRPAAPARRIHSASCHWYSERVDDRRRSAAAPRRRTRTDRSSAGCRRRAIGSRTCSAARRAPPGTKISHTPLDAERAHRMHASVPAVEVADDADAMGVGRPDGEVDAVGAADAQRVRAELVVDAGVVALAEQVEIEVGDDAAVAVRDRRARSGARPGRSRAGDSRGRRARLRAIASNTPSGCLASIITAGAPGRVISTRSAPGSTARTTRPRSVGMRTEDRERIGMSAPPRSARTDRPAW